MEIKNTYANSELASRPVQAGNQAAAQNVKPAVSDRDGDQDGSGRDSVTLSDESLMRAKASSAPQEQSSIQNRQQAQQMVDQLVTGFRNAPQTAMLAQGNAGQHVAGLLA